MREKVRKTGIDVIGNVPWGTHFCQFYETKEDLIDILAPYFKAGLENNEFCMWITSEPLHVEDAKRALKEKVKDLDDYIEKGQIEILDYRQWYTRSGHFDSNQVLEGWVEKEQHALEKGFDGLRLTGNTFWLEKKDWESFKNYEAAVNGVIGKYRMLTLCTYSLDKCTASEIIDVVSNHQFALVKRQDNWEIIESVEYEKTVEALRQSEARYRAVVENQTELIVRWLPGGVITFVNDAYCSYFGKSREELIGHSFMPLIPDEDHEKVQRHFDSLDRENPVETHEHRVVASNGEIPWQQWTNRVIFDERGRLVEYQSVGQDITDRKLTEEEKDRLLKTIETAKEAICIVSPNRIITYTNESMDKLFGYGNGELIGKDVSTINAGPKPEVTAERIKNAVEKEEEWEGEVHSKRKDGTEFLTRARISIFRDKDGKMLNYISTLHDITERKKAEESLKEALQKSESLIGAVGQIIYEHYMPENKVMWQGKYKEILDYTEEEMGHSTKDWLEKIHPDDLKAFKEELDKVIKGAKIYNLVYRFRHKSGDYLWFHDRGIVTHSPDGKSFSIIGLMEDITESKQANEQIDDLAKFPSENPNPVLRVAKSGILLYANDSSRSFLAEWNCQEGTIVPENWRQTVSEVFTTNSSKRLEIEHTGKTFAFLVVPVVEADYVNLYGQDITELRQAEMMVREESNFLHSALESITHPFYVVDINDYTVKVANSAADLSLNKGDATCYVLTHRTDTPCHSDEHPCPIEMIKKKGKPVTVEHIHYDKDGNARNFEIHGFPIFDSEGNFVEMIEYCLDITERKQAEEALKVHELRLQSLLDLNKMVTVSQQEILDFVREEVIKITQSQFAFIGFMNHDESVITINNWSKETMPKCAVIDKPMHFPIAEAGLWGEAVRQRKPIIINDYNAPDPRKKGYPKGHVPIKRYLGIPVFEGERIVAVAAVANKKKDYKESDVRSLTSMVNDMWRLIQRKRAQEQVESLAKFPSENPFPVLRISRDGTILYSNYTGLPLLSNWERQVGESAPQDWCQMISDVLDSNRNTIKEVKYGSRVVSFVLAPVAEEGYVNIYGRDVTKQKKVEHALQKARDDLEEKVRHRTAELSDVVSALRKEARERILAQEELQRSEARLQDAQRIAHIGNWDWDVINNNLWWSDEVYRIFGVKPQEFNATNEAFLSYVHPDDREFVKHSAYEALYEYKPYSIDHRIVRPDGTERIVHEQAEMTYNADDNPIRMKGTVQDITAQKETEKKILENQEQLRSLTAELLLSEERERRKIARDLHDSIGQILAFSDRELGTLQKSSPEKLMESVKEIRHYIKQAVKQTRTLTFDLSPPSLYDLGLEAALEELVEQFSKERKIKCSFEACDSYEPLAEHVKILIYRSIRELLMNAAKHSTAKMVRIASSRVNNDLLVTVEDDGTGFDISKLKPKSGNSRGFGLFSIRERLTQVDGQLDIQSVDGKGTRITLQVPLKIKS